MPAWVVWSIVAVLLAIGEIFTPGLFFLGPIALAAVASTVVAALGGAVWLQVVVFGVGSFAAVGLLRPIARRHLTTTGFAVLSACAGHARRPDQTPCTNALAKYRNRSASLLR